MSFDHGGTIYAAARSLGCRPADVLDLSASINPLGLSSSVRSACLAALDQVVHYPDPTARLLTDALATYHAVTPESIVVANGSTHLIHLLPSLFPASAALIIGPAFSEYRHSLTRHGWQINYHLLTPQSGFHLDTNRLGQQLREQQPKLLFFCTPGNPGGTLYSRDTIAAVLEHCRAVGTLLILDEAFMDFCGEEHSSKQLVIASGQGIVLRSLTKFYALAGLRLGCALAAPPLATRLRDALPPWEVNTVAQFAGVSALADHHHAAETRELITDERQLLEETLGRLPGLRLFPSSANYLLIELNERHTAPELQQRLLTKHRIMIRDCSDFVGLNDRYIRVAVRSRPENERLIEALTKEL